MSFLLSYLTSKKIFISWVHQILRVPHHPVDYAVAYFISNLHLLKGFHAAPKLFLHFLHQLEPKQDSVQCPLNFSGITCKVSNGGGGGGGGQDLAE